MDLFLSHRFSLSFIGFAFVQLPDLNHPEKRIQKSNNAGSPHCRDDDRKRNPCRLQGHSTLELLLVSLTNLNKMAKKNDRNYANANTILCETARLANADVIMSVGCINNQKCC